MGFCIIGPTRHVVASTIDDGGERPYDVLALPGAYRLSCPQIEKLHRRFYDSTTMRFAAGDVHALRDDLVRLENAYRDRREPELLRERHVRACDPKVRRAILERVLSEDTVFRVLEDLRMLCDEAIAAGADVQCSGD